MHERMTFPWDVEEAPDRIEARGPATKMIQLLNEAEHWLSLDEHCEGAQELAERIREFLLKLEVVA